jgi:citrate/tricarballylate utilization protein
VPPLESLARQAQALAETPWLVSERTPAEAEVARQMQICNACRYCEGFCAVFPAMTRRLEFGRADVHYLANLCHNCGACLHACQYAPPHEFAVNVPRAMASVRGQTYADFAWPPSFGALYRRNGLTVAMALAAGLSLFLALAAARQGSLWMAIEGGRFYDIFPHGLMVSLFLPIFAFAIVALALGVRQFWKALKPATSGADLQGPALAEASHDALKLRYLDGGHGEGCHNEDDAWTHARRRFHHLTFYGFVLCLASTSVATVYHYALGWIAPYDWPSLPKLLGVTGGIALSIGTAGLLRLRLRRHPDHVLPAQQGMDLGFIGLLLLTAVSGLLLMMVRQSAAMPLVLCAHLGAVMALFITMPYGKFAHGIYRVAAMLRYAVERRQPNRLGLGGE